MFQFLFDLPSSRATAIAYFALRLIKYLSNIPEDEKERRGRKLESRLSREDRDLARKIIEEIHETEGVQLGDLSQERAEEYIARLAAVVQDLTREQLNYDRERGKSLLDELRKNPTAWRPNELEDPDIKAKEVFERAVELLNQGDHSAAEREFRRAIVLEPSYVAVLHNSMIKSFENAEDWQRAISAMRFVVWVAPNYLIARNNLAVAYLNYGFQEATQGNFQLALDIYSTALGVQADSDIVSQIKRNMASSSTSLGIRARDEGDFEQSRNHLLRACSFDPTEPTRHNLGLAYALLGMSLVESERFVDAIYHFEHAVDTGFLSPEMLNYHGVALASNGRLSEAIRKFERALELMPSDSAIQENLSLARSQQNSSMHMTLRFKTEKIRQKYYQVPVQQQEYTRARLPMKSPEYSLPA